MALLALWGGVWAASLWHVHRSGAGASSRALLAAIAVAVVMRIALLFASPQFSDDLWRYLWEGKVGRELLDPFAQSPLSFADSDLVIDDPFWPHVNNPEITAIYPPAAQQIFRAVAALCYASPAMKAAMVLFDLAVLALLVAAMRPRGLALWAAIGWGWSPLVCFEVAGSGHLDVMAALGIVGWLILLREGREKTAAVMLGWAIAAKLVPVLLLPVALRWHRRRWTVALAPLVVLLFYAPTVTRSLMQAEPEMTLAQRIGLDDQTRALREFENRWRHNDSGFLVVYEATVLFARAVSDASSPTNGQGLIANAAAYDRMAASSELNPRENSAALRLAKRVIYVLYLMGLALILWRARRAESAALGALGLWLILSPVVHPWYLLLILPIALIERRRSWLLLSVTALFTYATVQEFRQTGDWRESWIAWALEWGTFYPLLLWELCARRSSEPNRDAV
jgi:hypothetical protein